MLYWLVNSHKSAMHPTYILKSRVSITLYWLHSSASQDLLESMIYICKGNHHNQPLDRQENTGLSRKNTLYILQMLKSASQAEVTSVKNQA